MKLNDSSPYTLESIPGFPRPQRSTFPPMGWEDLELWASQREWMTSRKWLDKMIADAIAWFDDEIAAAGGVPTDWHLRSEWLGVAHEYFKLTGRPLPGTHYENRRLPLRLCDV